MNDITNSSLVSIILATYNGEKYLAVQLDSLLAQTYTNMEIIATDDGSTDSTSAILNAYASRNPNIKVFINETNHGYIKNFEKGCSLSSGEYIALCDQDDYWEKDKIQKLIALIDKHAMVYCDSYLCLKDLSLTGRKISDVAVCKDFDNCLEQAVFCRIYGHATIFKRALYKIATPFLEIIPHDWWLAYNASLAGGIVFLNEPLVYYRQHESNLVGAVNTKRETKIKESIRRNKAMEIAGIRKRIIAFYNACPAEKTIEKNVLQRLVKSYESFTISNNFLRMFLFFKYQKLLLASKKRSLIRKYLFCFKMFVIIK